ncbi:hypothetical protein MGU_11650 [Metarhizium guizhouense ARSEF 977]|uniref:Uncharacterized protein n=1 Tax=Metarhizium guizhouense (strain ARSEF 977) TaxID=1276136 RepID=A0A0B4GTU0_METGA|nr:hypothetical protein MGU_11650 [Metarhizium guizhouense ARSEF 977]
MKPSLTLLTVLLGLAAAAPQDKSVLDDLSRNLEEDVKKTLADLEKQNKNVAGTIEEMAKLLGWQAAGNLPGNWGKGATILSLLSTSDYTVSKENAKEWSKNLGSTVISFLPKVGALGNIPGFLSMLKTVAIGIEKAQFPEMTARRQAEEKCFRDEGRTYKDLCENCKPHLTVSLLGKLNGCADKPVEGRDYEVDHVRVQAFCSEAVLCSGYKKGGTPDIIDSTYRYDPLRSFWCRDKDQQIGMLLSSWIGGTLADSLHMLDYDDFRKALEPVCKEALKGEVQSQCPTRDEIETANKEFPPYSYCLPGKIHNKEKLMDKKYQQDPQDPNFFVVTETRMQYRKEGESAGVWTGKCGTYIDSSDGKLNHGCCGPFKFDHAYAFAKPEDGEGWCHVASETWKVPEDLRKITVTKEN